MNFIFAYAILCSIPNKLGGVTALLFSIMILMILSFFNISKFQLLKFYFVFFWIIFVIVFLLTWIGVQPVEDLYILISQILACLYVTYFIINPMMFNLWHNLLY